ncbi:ATP-binding protein [Halorubellus sp. JP-L1]|uniref:AlbA family DNA-binding domain-containing protein n=1 Tax=Halorubellus sp. JP-L1 TaxID=2715753 RepID=UPI001409F2DD|nr:ATP-binding protein [Halorubellus sp. JP-L1]NHN41825.1 ATP-binding protein [Halorubellus sp. JP-L1]
MADARGSTWRLPDRVLELFRQGEYSGTRRTQTDAISQAVGGDLLRENEVLADAAQQGELVAERNYTPPGHSFYQDWDYAIGTPLEPPQQGLVAQDTFTKDPVDDVWFALDVESLISSVSKNWKNRGKEVHSFYLGVYDVAPMAATGCVIVLNVADLDRDPNEIIDGYREFDLANGSLAQSLDALAVIPIRYEKGTPEEAELVPDLLDADDELHYNTFVRTLSSALERRYQGEYQVSPNSIESVLSRQESDVLEFKAELPDHVNSLRKEVAALANHEGGALLLGVDDDGNPVGLDKIDSDEERVAGVLSDGLTSVVRNIKKARVDGADILIINVERTTTAPIAVDGSFYVRTGTTRDWLSGREIIDQYPR